MGNGAFAEGSAMLRDDEYLRLQTIFLAIAKHSKQPHERVRWLALVQACQQELLTADEMRSKPDSHWQRAA
jgi:hypothetical protein